VGETNARCCATIPDTVAPHLAFGRLVLVKAPTTAENLRGLVERALSGRAVDLLSIDVDRNTSHLGHVLKVAAHACCIAYNASVSPPIVSEVP